MTFQLRSIDRISALVHDSVRGDVVERLRHQYFIAGHLGIAAAGLAFLPIDLAIFGVPTLAHAIVYAGLLAPVIAVIIVHRTGRLFAAHALSSAAMVAMALIVAATGGAGLAASYAWLLLATLEAVFSFSVGLVVAIGVVAFVGSIAVGAMHSTGVVAVLPHAPGLLDAALLTPAIIATVALSLLAMRLHDARRSLARIGMANYESLAGALGDLILRQDRGGAVLYAGSESETLFGLPSRDLMGRGLFERIHVADRPAYLKGVSDAASSDRPVSMNLRLRRSSAPGEAGGYMEPVFVWVELRVRRLEVNLADTSDTDGAVVISVVRDVTLIKQHEGQLETARIEAEEANLWKDRFLANVSHELRTPLNAIIGFSEMLGSDDLMPRDPAKRKEYAEIINSSGHHLLSVVNSILDMSKIDAGRFEILPEPFEVAPLVDQCCDMLRLKAEASDIAIVKHVPAKIEELVADKRACKQILINLLSNAVKFTPEHGTVSIEVRPEGNSMVLSVSDTGIGIQARDLPRIGDPFFQARNTYDRPYEGTGLGLSVVKGLVGLHGGTISIESQVGLGTCISVRLPIDCRRASPKAGNLKIETISRRPQADEDNQRQAMVKKIA